MCHIKRQTKMDILDRKIDWIRDAEVALHFMSGEKNMRIAQINDIPVRSTGTIMKQISKYAWAQGVEVYDFTPNLFENNLNIPGHYFIGNWKSRKRHKFLAEWTGLNGFFSVLATLKMLRQFKELDVQLIHLHNLQGFCVNLPLLFRYIKKNKIPVVWTLHICWAFTGKCTHFSKVQCEKWKTGCYGCPQLNCWPSSKVDNSSFMWRWKKKHFTSVEKMTVVGCSEWMANLAKESFLGKHPVTVINNGINLHVFQPVSSDFRKLYHCENKVILLGVADNWMRNKGIRTMISLSESLDDRYQIVMVGTDERVDELLPKKVISIHRTSDKKELVKIYSAADIFLQPTQEENYPTVNMEALACGTPVITFNTGGSSEISDETCGRVIEYGDIEGMITAIEEQVKTQAMTREACLERAKKFSIEQMCEEYLQLYREMLNA